jgi:hypothetical protein
VILFETLVPFAAYRLPAVIATVPVPSALLFPALTVPPLMDVPPAKELFPERVKVLAELLVMDPVAPEIVPEEVP